NLKLGSTSSTLTLTPSDSNVASNFTLPQVTAATSGANYDTPTASGPVPGDTGTGATNYGYLYNWPAATAGETQASKPAGSSAATNSICPKSWHLPTGDSTGELQTLYVAMGSSAASWNYPGPFRGVLAGHWLNGFVSQSSSGFLWSSLPFSSTANNAFGANFYSGYVFPGVKYGRSDGFSVRCLLN
ncbi:MAG: FISUMP domain-containing protein, partial [Candidatus Saccharimonas sp.]